MNDDELARRAGFKNAAEAIAFYKKRKETSLRPGGSRMTGNDLMNKLFSWHPKVTLEHTLKKWKEATAK